MFRFFELCDLDEGGSGPTPNPDWPSTVLQIPFTGAIGDSIATDETGRHTFTFQGSPLPVVTNTDQLFSNNTMDFPASGSGQKILVNGNLSDFQIGTGDYLLQFFVRTRAIASVTQILFDVRSGTNDRLALYLTNTGSEPPGGRLVWLYLINGNLVEIHYSSDVVALNTWTFIELSRTAGGTRSFINGIGQGVDITGRNLANAVTQAIIGSDTGTAQNLNGQIANLRFLKGHSGNVANYTPPAAPFPGEFL